MLNNYTQTINATAASSINGKTALFMGAAIRSGEAPNINSSYQDVELYQANKEEVDADFEEFKRKVFELSGGDEK